MKGFFSTVHIFSRKNNNTKGNTEIEIDSNAESEIDENEVYVRCASWNKQLQICPYVEGESCCRVKKSF